MLLDDAKVLGRCLRLLGELAFEQKQHLNAFFRCSGPIKEIADSPEYGPGFEEAYAGNGCICRY